MRDILISMLSLGGIGLIFGIVLSILDKKLKVLEDPIVEKIIEALPQINCGACGYAGCAAYAKAIVVSKDLGVGCLPGGDEVNLKLADLIGANEVKSEKLKIVVLCGALVDKKKKSFIYKGTQTCAVANNALGNIDCRYGCMGFGDCVNICPTQALIVENGLVRVEYDKCIGCGKCVNTCPREVLKLVKTDSKLLYAVACSNPDNTLLTKKVCATGCIGCGICIRLVKDSPFYLENKLSKIDYDKIKETSDLEVVVTKCPVKIIKTFHV